MKDTKYSLEIMKQEIESQYISPEIKYAFGASIEALEKRIPKLRHEYKNGTGVCDGCGKIANKGENYCTYCGQALKWGD